ncbi:hypothetical protein Lser_V15G02684 [Lactuca serriola]
METADSVNIQETSEFKYEKPNWDDIYSVFEEVSFGDINGNEIEHRHSYSSGYFDQNGLKEDEDDDDDDDGEDDDESGWETISHLEDQWSNYSPNRSDPSVTNNNNNNREREENDETTITEITEVCPVPSKWLQNFG